MPLYNINSGPRGFLQPDEVTIAQPYFPNTFATHPISSARKAPARWRGMWAYGQTLNQMADPGISFTNDVITGTTFTAIHSLPFLGSVWADPVTADAVFGFGSWDVHDMLGSQYSMSGVAAFSFVFSYWVYETPTSDRGLWATESGGGNWPLNVRMDQNGGHYAYVIFADYSISVVSINYLGPGKLHTIAGWVDANLGQMGLHQKDGPYVEGSALGAKSMSGTGNAISWARNGNNGYNAIRGAGAYAALYSSVLPLPVLKNLAQDPYHYHIR